MTNDEIKQSLRGSLDARFDALGDGDAIVIAREMLDDAFGDTKSAAAWYEARGGLLSPVDDDVFRLSKSSSR